MEFKSSSQGYIKSFLFENDHSSNCLIFPLKRSISYKELRKHMKLIEIIVGGSISIFNIFENLPQNKKTIFRIILQNIKGMLRFMFILLVQSLSNKKAHANIE